MTSSEAMILAVMNAILARTSTGFAKIVFITARKIVSLNYYYIDVDDTPGFFFS